MPTPIPSPQGQYFCETCVVRFDGSGDCPQCKADILVDLLDEDVLLMLSDRDTRATQQRMGLLTGISIALCLPIWGGLLFLRPKLVVAAYIGGVLALSALLNAIFPAKKITPDMGQAF